MKDDRVLCEHPDPEKQGVRIDARKYHVLREAILAAIPLDGDMAFKDLREAVRERLSESALAGIGSLGWYVTSIKLDLEAKGLIERVPGQKPQRLRHSQSK